jgi:ABC-type multidrug transport system fused ATPase/permease subunit
MISGERVMRYTRLEPEAELETLPQNEKPPPSWPDKGMITMEDVAFQYSSELPLVLKDLCFTIQPAEKVGIVGRTGAGKSSLISVLYRLAEPHGLITIDGVDTKAIGLHDLRKKMSIIPQDPVLFSGTMRYNLDPFDEYTDAELWKALEQVQLKSHALMKQLLGQALLLQSSNGGEILKCHGDLGVQWTSSRVQKQTNTSVLYRLDGPGVGYDTDRLTDCFKAFNIP